MDQVTNDLHAQAQKAALAGQFRDAIGHNRKILYEDFGDSQAILNLADAYRSDGQFAAAVLWYRRALEHWPESRSIRASLAECLLRREHWNEGFKILQALETYDDLPLPHWDGRTNSADELYVTYRQNIGMEPNFIGFLAMSQLVEKGRSISLDCPPSFLPLAEKIYPGVNILSGSEVQGETSALLHELPFYIGRDPGPLPTIVPQRDGDDRAAKAINNVAVVTDGISDSVHVLDDDLIGELDHRTTAALSNIDGGIPLDQLGMTLTRYDAVVTDSGIAALLASAMNRPVILILPIDAPWWWGDRGYDCIWFGSLNMVRFWPGRGLENCLAQITELISRHLPAPVARPPLRPRKITQRILEGLDWVAPYFGRIDTESVRVRKLEGGTHNKVMKVSWTGGERVLRLGKYPPHRKDTVSKEIANMVLASKAGIAPELFYTEPLDGTMISEFIPGIPMTTKSIRRERNNALTIARLYRRLHTLAPFQHTWSIFEKLDENTSRLIKNEFADYMEQEKFNRMVETFVAVLRDNQVPDVPTHNDPLSRNFMKTRAGIMLIDWETSAMGDPHWDVGALSAQAGLKRGTRRAYIKEYFGRDDHPAACRIRLYETICRYYWWADSLVDGMKKPEGKDWQTDASDWWRWFQEIINADDFEENLSQAKSYRWSEADRLPAPD